MMTLTAYHGCTVAVLGLGISGEAVVRSLNAGGANVIAWDDRAEVVSRLQKESLEHVTFENLLEADWEQIELLVLSAGIPFTHPTPHPVVIKAQASGCAIVCDIELLYHQCPEATYIGITGTNGKSTTTALIGHVLKSCGVTVAVGGNIGQPGMALAPLSKGGVYVIEMSSYQLDLLDKMHFDVAVLLNVTPDHLERHGGMEGYRQAKMHIFDRQTPQDQAIIGMDTAVSRRCFEQLSHNVEGPVCTPISTEKVFEGGVQVAQQAVIAEDKQWELGALPKLPGTHNAENIAAAWAVARILALDPVDVVAAIGQFEGLAHRMQWVTKINNVTFINDSKATNAEAASKALAAYPSVYWIAGGKPKEGGIDSLVEFFPRIKKAYMIGESEEQFAQVMNHHQVACEQSHTLENAVKMAAQEAFEGGQEVVVLFSPACASFDQWPNFEKRGEAFCQYVNQLVGNDAV